jgi:hypothetical protein
MGLSSAPPTSFPPYIPSRRKKKMNKWESERKHATTSDDFNHQKLASLGMLMQMVKSESSTQVWTQEALVNLLSTVRGYE